MMKIRLNTCAVIVFFASGMSLLPALQKPEAQAASTIPFVGCASDGQVGPRKAPHGKAKNLSLSPEVAGQIAYYQAQEGSGVLAPRGWHCFGTYGSSGGSLFVTPQAIDSKLLFSVDWEGFSGPVVQISDVLGGTSGRFEVAAIIARVFPTHKAFVVHVIDEGIETTSDFPSGPYPKDKLVYRSKEIVEYETPPQTEGLGTRSRLQKNARPIIGAAILTGPNEELNLTLLSTRLPRGFETLAPAIIQRSEREATLAPTD